MYKCTTNVYNVCIHFIVAQMYKFNISLYIVQVQYAYFIIIQCIYIYIYIYIQCKYVQTSMQFNIYKFIWRRSDFGKIANNRREETFARHSIPSLATSSRDRYVRVYRHTAARTQVSPLFSKLLAYFSLAGRSVNPSRLLSRGVFEKKRKKEKRRQEYVSRYSYLYAVSDAICNSF